MVRACVLTLAVLLAAACSREQPPLELEQANSAYFWRTELRLDSTERAFLGRYHINKVYCRYFDVVVDSDAPDAPPHPLATIAFADTLPSGIALVPTVYITEECMHRSHEGLAQKVVERVVQMNATHGISGVDELQIDCDYTERSRHIYYPFLDEVRRLAAAHGMRLSTTIRLHQLAMAPPPADYGVLMLYNTGDPRRFMERNPVLDERDVRPYARYLKPYAMPLAAAYHVYRWVRQVHGVRIEHSVEDSVIIAVKQLVEQHRPELARSIIIYHLDEENINRYSHETFEAIYRH